MSPVNTAYMNVGGAPIALPSQFTVALGATTVVGNNQAESSFSIPARLLPLNKASSFVNTGAPLMVAPDSALSAGLIYCAYLVPATNTVTLRFSAASTATVTQRAGTWGFAFLQGLP